MFITDGEPIKLPDNLESLPRADHFPTQRHRWNTNEVSQIDSNGENLLLSQTFFFLGICVVSYTI